MSDHEDLIRSLLVERYRTWQPDVEPELRAKQSARTIERERPNRQAATYRRRRPQPKTTEGGRTT